MGIEEQASAKDLISISESERAKLLLTPDGSKLQDPLQLNEGLIREERGITSWPPMFLSDITKYLMQDHPGKDVQLHERVLNEYKEGKAYRLMSSTCIHVTALMFRILAANRNGLTNPACTSKDCVWSVPNAKTVIKPSRICEMDWKAPKLNKEPARPSVDSRRILFASHSEVKTETSKEKRQKFYHGLKFLLPESNLTKLGKAEFEEEHSSSENPLILCLICQRNTSVFRIFTN
ncbi:hypothetical protein AC249_AIPGENE19303 [Exaiptasia diaphana]|nr:hypothetical protein AC249_AIPGENE19303 [Exaiptasia diaphana]